jgi:hypothetical protein
MRIIRAAFPSRLSLETMLRRLIFGNGRYPHIEQSSGLILMFLATRHAWRKVTVRTKEGEMTLPTALVVGQFISEILTAP